MLPKYEKRRANDRTHLQVVPDEDKVEDVGELLDGRLVDLKVLHDVSGAQGVEQLGHQVGCERKKKNG